MKLTAVNIHEQGQWEINSGDEMHMRHLDKETLYFKMTDVFALLEQCREVAEQEMSGDILEYDYVNELFKRAFVEFQDMVISSEQ